MHISEGILSGSVLIAGWAGTTAGIAVGLRTGRTDEQGRFAFIPDVPVEWRVIVRDEEGHQCTAAINVSEALIAEVHNDSNNDLWLRALFGVSIIFNIAMFILRRSGHAH